MQGFSILHAAVQGERCRACACTPATATSWHVPAPAASSLARTGSVQLAWGVHRWLQLALQCCTARQFGLALHLVSNRQSSLGPPCAAADPSIAEALSDKHLKATVFFPQDKAFTDFLAKNVSTGLGSWHVQRLA